jgi:hypothetical protein
VDCAPTREFWVLIDAKEGARHKRSLPANAPTRLIAMIRVTRTRFLIRGV